MTKSNLASAFSALLFTGGLIGAYAAAEPFTIADTIAFHRFEPASGEDSELTFSPDKKHFVLIESWGDVATNSRKYRLNLFSSIYAGPVEPTTIAEVASGQFPGIKSPTWLDNDNVAYIVKDGASARVIAFNIENRGTRELASHETDIVAFAATTKGDIFYAAAPPARQEKADAASPIVLAGQTLGSLFERVYEGGHHFDPSAGGASYEAFFQNATGRLAKLEFEANENPVVGLPFRTSPNGKFIVFPTDFYIDLLPPRWRSFESPPGTAIVVGFRLLDVNTGELRWLIDRPSYWGSPVWMPDSKSVVTPSLFPRSGGPDTSPAQALEIRVDGNVMTHLPTDSRIVAWQDYDVDTSVLRGSVLRTHTPLELHKIFNGWVLLRARKAKQAVLRPAEISQAINAPPMIVFNNGAFYDPNAGLRQKTLGKLEEVSFPGTDGERYSAGLFTPANIQSGGKYPLVVQSHGWRADQFMLNGPADANYTARILTTRGFIVLQLPSVHPPLADEGRTFTAMVDGAISYLDSKHIVDTSRIGIQAWSRTGYGVRYALSHSRYKFLAASMLASMEGGYMELIQNSHKKEIADFVAGLNGHGVSRPGIESWPTQSAVFDVDRSDTAILLINCSWPIAQLETFSRMRLSGKPVELVLLPKAQHNPVLPIERLVSQGETADWFQFWLTRYEDPDPSKAEQYSRWRELRTNH